MILPLELRDGRLWFGSIRCQASDSDNRLSEDTLLELELIGVMKGLRRKGRLRILHCTCDRYFIADAARNRCEECQQAATAETAACHFARRTARRANWRRKECIPAARRSSQFDRRNGIAPQGAGRRSAGMVSFPTTSPTRPLDATTASRTWNTTRARRTRQAGRWATGHPSGRRGSPAGQG